MSLKSMMASDRIAGSVPIIKQAEPHLAYKQEARKVPTWIPKNTLWLFIISGEEWSNPPMTRHWNENNQHQNVADPRI